MVFTSLWLSLFTLSFLSVGASGAELTERARTSHVQLEFVSEHRQQGIGQESWVGLRFEMAKEWHIYWKNPGDSGLAPSVEWLLPKGWSVSETIWMIPQRIVTLPIVNYGYGGETLLGFRLNIPASETPGQKNLKAKVTWLVCKEVCITEKAELQLPLTLDKQSGPKNSWSIAFDQLREQQPQVIQGVSGTLLEKSLELQLPKEFVTEHRTAKWDIFPLQPLWIKGDVPPKFEEKQKGFTLSMEKADPFQTDTPSFGAWLVAEEGGKRKSFILETAPAPGMPGSGGAPTVDEFSIATLFFFALLGGVLLNFMPCVFPVLGIKVLSLAKQSAKPALHGKAYSMGVVISFWALALLLMMFRSFGHSLGWGFQLQSPYFVIALAFLFSFMAWNLLGVFELSGNWMGVGASLAGKDGLAGSFFSGILAVVVASPCTAPFMGTAMAVALDKSALVVFGVFTFMGLGLAFPFWLLSLRPQWVKFLPRSGIWMERLKQFFSVPLFLTVVWLLWVLRQQNGNEAMLLAFLGVLCFSVTLFFSKKFSKEFYQRALWTALLLVGPALGVAAAGKVGHTKISYEQGWEKFEASKVEQSILRGEPIFIDFTAAWCISCQVNKRLVLQTKEMKAFLEEKKIHLFLADYTNYDPAITEALNKYGAAGVPLYVVYREKTNAPKILPTILTAGILKEAF